MDEVINTDECFETYLERYCKTYDVSKEEAKNHSIVKEVKQYYDNL